MGTLNTSPQGESVGWVERRVAKGLQLSVKGGGDFEDTGSLNLEEGKKAETVCALARDSSRTELK